MARFERFRQPVGPQLQGIPKDTLQMDDVIDDMTRVSKLSSLKHPRTGVALLLQLLSVKSHTRERTPGYLARGGGQAASRSSSTKVYVVASPDSLTGSNVVMVPLRGGTIQINCLFFCSRTLLPTHSNLFSTAGHNMHAFGTCLNVRDSVHE